MSNLRRIQRRAAVSDREQTRRMMQRWVMEEAYVLQDAENMSWQDALRKSYLVRDLLEALGRGIAEFTYMKHDGTERVARGTLCHGVSEAFDSYKFQSDGMHYCGGNVVTYWDLDQQGFRAFRTERLVSILNIIVK